MALDAASLEVGAEVHTRKARLLLRQTILWRWRLEVVAVPATGGLLDSGVGAADRTVVRGPKAEEVAEVGHLGFI